MTGSEFSGGAAARSTSLADVVAPFGRLPAPLIVFIADNLLESMDRMHAGGSVGLDLRPEMLTFGIGGTLTFGPPQSSPPWLLPPERARGEPASSRGDLFSAGALLTELLLGQRILDGGSPEATAQRLLAMRTPPPLFSLCPTLPGVLEQLLGGLLQPDANQRPVDAVAARALLGDLIEVLGRQFPAVIDKIIRDPREIAAALHQHQAQAEAGRGQKLVGDPASRNKALVSLLRSHQLVPGQPEVAQLLAQAAGAGVIRGGQPASPALSSVVQQIAQAEPQPPDALLRQAVELHQQEGDLLERLGLLKRLWTRHPEDRALAAQIDALTAPPSPDEPWASGGSWTADASPQAPLPGAPMGDAGFGAPGGQQGFMGSGASMDGAEPTPAPSFQGFSEPGPKGPLGQVFATLGQLHGGLEPRARLFIMVLVFSAITSLMMIMATGWGAGSSTNYTQMQHLSQMAFDCEPGGKQVLVQAYTAARLGEAEATERLVSEAEVVVPMGTRCQKYGMELMAKARMAERVRP